MSAREENLWLRWKQNSETKIRPLETHTDARTQTHAQTHVERKERKNTNAKKAQHGNKREREKEREKEPQERNKERVLLVILTISFVFFDVCTECREDEGLWCFFQGKCTREILVANMKHSRGIFGRLFFLFLCCVPAPTRIISCL